MAAAMSAVLCCLKKCVDGLGLGLGMGLAMGAAGGGRREPIPICLDTAHMGHEVVIVKNGQRICGSGGALASAPLVQSKAYFEVKIQQSGMWGVGLASRAADLDRAPGGHDHESWVLCWDGVLRANGADLHKIPEVAQEGDILGVSYDHIELNFYVNGKAADIPMTGVRGSVYPALYGMWGWGVVSLPSPLHTPLRNASVGVEVFSLSLSLPLHLMNTSVGVEVFSLSPQPHFALLCLRCCTGGDQWMTVPFLTSSWTASTTRHHRALTRSCWSSPCCSRCAFALVHDSLTGVHVCGCTGT